MKRTVHYLTYAETEDGKRYPCDYTERPTIDAAKKAWSLNGIRREIPDATKIIITEVVETDILIAEQEIDGHLAVLIGGAA